MSRVLGEVLCDLDLGCDLDPKVKVKLGSRSKVKYCIFLKRHLLMMFWK